MGSQCLRFSKQDVDPTLTVARSCSAHARECAGAVKGKARKTLSKFAVSFLAMWLVASGLVFAQQQQAFPNITTVAGGGPTTIPAINGAINNIASTGEIGQMAWDSAHNLLYFTSSTFNRVYKYDPAAGQATAIAGNGFTGFGGDGGPALQATFGGPLGIALDPTNPNLLYVSDTGNNRVRRIDLSSGTVDTISGDGTCVAGQLTYTNVATASANICAPGQMAIDGNGVLYVFDLTRRVVWRMAAGQARMIAGNSSPSFPLIPVAAGTATSMSLADFAYLAADPSGQFLYLNETIGLRQLNLTTGILSAPLDTSANTPFLNQNGGPTGSFIPLQRVGSPVAVDPATGNVIYAIYEQGAASESVFSYNPSSGQKTFVNGKGSTSPVFLTPTSDVNLGAMNNGLGELVAITPGGAAGTFVASRSGWIHTMDSGANFTTVLGNGFRSFCGDGGPATSACLDSPGSVAGNGDGSFFIADTGNSVVRFVDANGIIHSLVSPKSAGAPPDSIAVVPVSNQGNVLPPPGNLLFTSIAKHQVFALDPVADQTTLYSGDGKDACANFINSGFCDPHVDFGLRGAEYDQPRGLVIDQLGNPLLTDPNLDSGNGPVGVIDCLLCDDTIITIFGFDPITFANIFSFGQPDALAVDTDGLLVAEKGAQKIQHLTAVTGFNGARTGFDGWPTTDILNNRQLPLPNVSPFIPVGVTKIPGHIIAADDFNRIVWSATRPINLGPCPQGAVCIAPPPPPQLVGVFAGGGTLYQDNIPAYQAAFGFRQVEAGVFDPQDAFGELNGTQVSGESLVYITDRADNRIRLVDAGTNHPPVADAGTDRNVPLDSSGSAQVLLDGSASTDPDGDALTYVWTESGNPLGTSAFVQTSLTSGKHTITLTVTDGFGGSSSATVNITATPPVDLSIAATPSATTVNAGSAVTYTATLANLGPNDATGVMVTLPLQSSTDFVSGSAAGGCTGPASGTAGVVTCLVGNLTNGTGASLSITVQPNTAGTLASTLSVSGNQGDPDTSNNSAALSVTVNPLNAVQVNVAESIQVTDSVTPQPSVMLQDSELIHVTDIATVSSTVNTPLGQPTVNPPDQNGQPSNISVTFSGGVTAAGFTSVNISPTGPPLPAGFQLAGNPAMYLDIQTTAQFNPPVIVCVPLNPVPAGAALLHFNTATQQWEDLTIRPVPTNGPICTQVNSLSPFALVASSNHPPVANAGSNQTLEATSPAGAAVTLSGSATDQDNDQVTLAWSENGVALGTGAQITVTFSVGVHTVTLTANDGHGGTGTATVLITVQDTTPPTLTLPANQVLEATSPAGSVASFTATASDIVDGVRPVLCAPASGSIFPLGVTTVNCTASDFHGNTASGQFTITVRDTTPPLVVPPANITVSATEASGVRGAAWPALAAFLAGASATDVADPAPVQLPPQAAGVSSTSNTLFPYGTTTVTFRFRDASGNVGTAKATVTVILGSVKISAKLAAQGVNPDGTTFVDVTIGNTGTGNARKLQVDLITAVPTKGFGRVVISSPIRPLTIGNLNAGASQTIHIVMKVPSTVKQFAVAEAGSYTNVKGFFNLFAQAQTVP